MAEGRDSGGDEQRVEALLRTNAELAAEVRSLTLGRADAPRSAPMPTSRRLAVLHDERDTLAAELEAAQAELEVARTEIEAGVVHRGELEHDNAEFAAELARLRGGLRGFLRRLRARLLRN